MNELQTFEVADEGEGEDWFDFLIRFYWIDFVLSFRHMSRMNSQTYRNIINW